MNGKATFASGLAACLVAAAAAQAAVWPADSPLQKKAFRHSDLKFSSVHQPMGALDASLAGALGHELAALGVSADQGFYDVGAGRWGTLILSEPLIPGSGAGNALRWEDLGLSAQPEAKDIERQAWRAFQAFLRRAEGQLRVDLEELDQPRVAVFDGGALVQMSVGRVVEGVPVRDNNLTAVINHGNLVLLGLNNWGTVESGLQPALAPEDARGVVAQFVQPMDFEADKGKPSLELIPARGAGAADGRDFYRLAWAVRGHVGGDLGNWEALVDAASGELLSFEDRNQYAKAKPQIMGGVFPESDDGNPPDGVEQGRWPMPFADLTSLGSTTFANSAGIGRCQGTSNPVVSHLSGQFVGINDACGAVNETSADRLLMNLGASAGSDCTVPAGHSAGDTHASRTSYYQVNRLVEQATGYLPTNNWLHSQVPANVNIVASCNAFWNGSSVNFYRSNAQCGNTGEIAGVIAHEWGHGMDNNGVNATGSNPGEGLADVHSLLRIADSCMGRGFFKTHPCGGYGDPCTTCTGIREADFAKHQSGLPHDLTWIDTHCGGGGGPCGGEVHCEGIVVGEVAWDLFARDFKAAPFFFDNNTALELTTRLFFIGSGPVGNWYQCTPPSGGCNASGGYLNLLAVDDDNGNLSDGTPHMTAIFGAFNRHQMACGTPSPVNAGCAGGPTAAPVVTATAIDQGASLSWAAVPGAARYAVYRTEGVSGCNFGKTRVGETTTTKFVDQGMRNAFGYSYTVLPIGANSACFGKAAACTSATPVAGANLSALANPAVQVLGGDGDDFLDNCETGRPTIQVENNGAATLTNVRITKVTPLTHPGTVITTPLPVILAASLPPCGAASGTFDFVPHGMTFNQTTQLLVEITANELAGQTRTTTVSVSNVESNFQANASRTWGFETNLEGWTVTSGTFARQPGGAQGTQFHLSSSQCLDGQCDTVRTPLVRLQGNSTLSLFHRYDTETPVPTPYDRANVGVVDLGAGSRTTVVPSGGKLYDLPPGTVNGACVTLNQAGWSADTDTDCTATAAFTQSSWSSAALNPGGVFSGRKAQLEVAYATDPGANGYGFDFDQVTLTNFDLQVADTQACTIKP